MATAGTVQLPSVFYKDLGDELIASGELKCDEPIVSFGVVDPITGDESDTGAIAIHHYNLV